MPSWSGLFNNVLSNPEGAVDGHSLLGSRTNLERRVSRIFRKPGARKLKELMLTLNGAAAGQSASASYVRVDGAQDVGIEGDGQMDLETVSVINRNTAAADEAAIDDVIDGTFAPASYPVDRSGNGGGDKLRGKAY